MKAKLARPVAALLISGSFALSGIAYAGGGTSVTIKGPQGDFQGKVSTRDPCRGDRKVKVFKVKKGPDRKIGVDTTDDDGNWSIGTTGFKNGRFYAKLRRAEGCEGAISPTIRLVDGEQV